MIDPVFMSCAINRLVSLCMIVTFTGLNKKAPGGGALVCKCMAEWTGLEPATPGVTGRYSNQLNYHSAKLVGAEGFEPPTYAL